MITKEQAFSIIRKEKPNHKITTSYEFPDKFAFVVMPKDADPDTFICTGTFVMKKDGHIKYGMPTVQEMEHAVAITEEKELKHEDLAPDELMHHGVRGMKWGKRNGPPYPLNATGKASLRTQRMASYGKSVTKGGDYSGPSYDNVSVSTSKDSVKNNPKVKKNRFTFIKKKEQKEKDVSKTERSEEEIKALKEKAIREGDLETVKQNRDQFTDNEIRAAITRHALNQDLNKITVKNVKTGAQKVDSIITGIQRATRLAGAGIDAWNMAARVCRPLGINMPMFDGNKPKQEQRNIADRKNIQQLENIIRNPEKYTSADIGNAKKAYENLTQAQNQVRANQYKNISLEEAFINPEKYTEKELKSAISRAQTLDGLWKATARKQEEYESFAQQRAEIFRQANDNDYWFERE